MLEFHLNLTSVRREKRGLGRGEDRLGWSELRRTWTCENRISFAFSQTYIAMSTAFVHPDRAAGAEASTSHHNGEDSARGRGGRERGAPRGRGRGATGVAQGFPGSIPTGQSAPYVCRTERRRLTCGGRAGSISKLKSQLRQTKRLLTRVNLFLVLSERRTNRPCPLRTTSLPTSESPPNAASKPSKSNSKRRPKAPSHASSNRRWPLATGGFGSSVRPSSPFPTSPLTLPENQNAKRSFARSSRPRKASSPLPRTRPSCKLSLNPVSTSTTSSSVPPSLSLQPHTNPPRRTTPKQKSTSPSSRKAPTSPTFPFQPQTTRKTPLFPVRRCARA